MAFLSNDSPEDLKAALCACHGRLHLLVQAQSSLSLAPRSNFKFVEVTALVVRPFRALQDGVVREKRLFHADFFYKGRYPCPVVHSVQVDVELFDPVAEISALRFASPEEVRRGPST